MPCCARADCIEERLSELLIFVMHLARVLPHLARANAIALAVVYRRFQGLLQTQAVLEQSRL
jgi:hypothetical protein